MKKILSIVVLAMFILALIAPFALADEQAAEKLPYQEFTDKGWIYNGKETSFYGKYLEYEVKMDKLFDVAYSPLLNQNERLILVVGNIKPNGEGWAVLRDFGPISELSNLHGGPDSQEFWNFTGVENGALESLVSINGVAWQKTKYADMYLKALVKKEPAYNDVWYLKYIKDPKYNGYTGAYITFDEGIDLYLNSDKMDVRNELKEYQRKLPVKVFSDGGNAMIPLRGVLEELGASVGYDDKTKEIVIIDKGHAVKLKIGSDIAMVDGKEKRMPKPVYTKNGYTVIPLRFVSENLDHYVGFFPEDGNRIAILRVKDTYNP